MSEAMKEFSETVGALANDSTVGAIVQDRLYKIFMLGVEYGHLLGEWGVCKEDALTKAMDKWCSL